MFSMAYIQALSRRRLFLPPWLKLPLPVQFVILPLLALAFPIFVVFIFIRFLIGTTTSYARVKILEADQSKIQSLHTLFREGQEDVGHGIHPDDQPAPSSGSRPQGLKSSTPYLTPVQLQMANSLNSIPHLNKKFAFIDGVRNSHVTIVAPKGWISSSPERGMGVVRHWAEYFVL
ncbi:hypothetical protein BS47DRAFT_711231 [Hydnum rufescens UP504]|uniref:Uncharacterized protein n=1 Tax=Hydnum rufescens UP504 TaxID=1448309 RepID=A0A9P6B1L7_9AGAM|nr:hypothetical protein BS47DRAFT_711231 [Hydnum rufescens UP504]